MALNKAFYIQGQANNQQLHSSGGLSSFRLILAAAAATLVAARVVAVYSDSTAEQFAYSGSGYGHSTFAVVATMKNGKKKTIVPRYLVHTYIFLEI